jgi:hypothetical protein
MQHSDVSQTVPRSTQPLRTNLVSFATGTGPPRWAFDDELPRCALETVDRGLGEQGICQHGQPLGRLSSAPADQVRHSTHTGS